MASSVRNNLSSWSPLGPPFSMFGLTSSHSPDWTQPVRACHDNTFALLSSPSTLSSRGQHTRLPVQASALSFKLNKWVQLRPYRQFTRGGLCHWRETKKKSRVNFDKKVEPLVQFEWVHRPLRIPRGSTCNHATKQLHCDKYKTAPATGTRTKVTVDVTHTNTQISLSGDVRQDNNR